MAQVAWGALVPAMCAFMLGVVVATLAVMQSKSDPQVPVSSPSFCPLVVSSPFPLPPLGGRVCPFCPLFSRRSISTEELIPRFNTQDRDKTKYLQMQLSLNLRASQEKP